MNISKNTVFLFTLLVIAMIGRSAQTDGTLKYEVNTFSQDNTSNGKTGTSARENPSYIDDKREAKTTHFIDLPMNLKFTTSEAIGHNQAVYHAEKLKDGFRTNSPTQDYTCHFRSEGVSIDAGQSLLHLRLIGLGYGDHIIPVSEAQIFNRANRIEYHRGSLIEWYVNGPLGLQQGFTFHSPLEFGDDEQHLTLTLAINDGWQIEVSDDRHHLTFTNENGISFRYGDLFVYESDGQELPAYFTLNSASSGFKIIIDDSGATYPVTVDPIIQKAYLKASNPGEGDNFGYSIAISGETVVIGANREDGNGIGGEGDNSSGEAGAAYVFVRNGSTWSQQAYLKASNPGSADFFGCSVGISGETIIVGADGEASNGSSEGNNSAHFSGAAYIFVRDGTTWSQQAYLKASNVETSDQFGYSVAIDGETAVVGAIEEDSNGTGGEGDNSARDAGAAYVFVRNGTTWAQQAYLKATNAESFDKFGYSVAIDGETILVGAYTEDGNGIDGEEDNSILDSGAVYVFERSATNMAAKPGTQPWNQSAYLKASNAGSGDRFGASVAIGNGIAVVGAYGEASNGMANPGDNSSTYAGAAYVFYRNGMGWNQQAYLKSSDTSSRDFFGLAVSVSGETVVVGAGGQGENSSEFSGAGYIFRRNGSSWSQQNIFKPSNSEGNDYFGGSVGISGNTIAVGAPSESSNGIDGEGDNSSPESGAAYIFDQQDNPMISISDVSAVNEGTDAIFTVSLDVNPSSTVTVNYSTADGTATAPNDYTPVTNETLTFTPSISTLTVTITTIDDAIAEPTETFSVSLSNPTNASLSNSQGTATILDNDDPPNISVNDVTASESSGLFTFTVTLDTESSLEVSLDYATADGSATAPNDYTDTNGTLTFPAGATTGTFTVSINDDNIVEFNETFFVDLSNPMNSTISDNQAIGTILDNDIPTVSISDAPAVDEGSDAVFTVSLDVDPLTSVSLIYSTSNGTAIAPDDYTPITNQTLTFNPQTTTQTISVSTIDDALDESDENFFIDLLSATNANIHDNRAVGTINDNDGPVTLTIDDVTAPEDESLFTFTVTLDTESSLEVSLDYATADGSATAPNDYTDTNGTLTFPARTTTGTFSVSINDDNIVEFNETFFVDLSNPRNATISDNQAIGIIVDNDQPMVSISDAPEITEGQDAVFTVSLDVAPVTTLTVTLSTDDGIATSPSDYIAVTNQTLTFDPQTTTQTISITTIDDATVEPEENFFVNLISTTNATILDNQGIGIIKDNDMAGVNITQSSGSTDVTEGSATDSYLVELTSSPLSDVTLTIDPDDQLDVGKGAGNSTSLTFTSTNWSTSQSVPVIAVDDVVVEGDHTGIITHSVTSSDANYNGLAVDNVTVKITDNDMTAVGHNDVVYVDQFALEQNYPNPFNSETTIYFSVKETCHVLLKVIDILGQEIVVLVDSEFSQGKHKIVFSDQELPSGIYFYTIRMGGFHDIKKMILLE